MHLKKTLLLALLCAGPVAAQGIKVCAEAWPPFLYRDAQGVVSGLAVPWLERAAANLGQSVQFQFLSLVACRQLAARGAVDALAFTPNNAQLDGWLFTREPMVFWILNAMVPYNAPHTSFRDLSQFAGQRVGWGRHYRYPDRLVLWRDWERVPVFDSEAALTLLLRGKADVVFDDERFVAATLSQPSLRRLRVLQPLAASMAQPVAVRPGLANFAQALDEEAQQWRQNGELDRFYRKYYHSSLAAVLAASE